VIESSRITTSLAVLDEPLGLLDHHLRDLHVPARRLVEGGGNNLALHRSLHVRHLLRPLVDQQHDEVAFGMVLRDGRRDLLQEDGLAGARRRHDQASLALADRRDEIDDARLDLIGTRLEDDPLARGRAASDRRS
jgi:hypothetical protein